LLHKLHLVQCHRQQGVMCVALLATPSPHIQRHMHVVDGRCCVWHWSQELAMLTMGLCAKLCHCFASLCAALHHHIPPFSGKCAWHLCGHCLSTGGTVLCHHLPSPWVHSIIMDFACPLEVLCASPPFASVGFCAATSLASWKWQLHQLVLHSYNKIRKNQCRMQCSGCVSLQFPELFGKDVCQFLINCKIINLWQK